MPKNFDFFFIAGFSPAMKKLSSKEQKNRDGHEQID
jgi:hypothetical protein